MFVFGVLSLTVRIPDLLTTRRYFIQFLAAALLCPIERVRASLRNRHWDHYRFSGWRLDPSQTRLVAQLLRRRSDGEYFYVNAISYPESTDAARALDVQLGELTIDSFLNCSCIAHRECWEHRRMFGHLLATHVESDLGPGPVFRLSLHASISILIPVLVHHVLYSWS